MNETYKVGDKFLCVNDCFINGDPNYKAYTKGKTYYSEKEGCITDDTRNMDHFWHKLSTTNGLVIFEKYQEESNNYEIY